jgi:hypothetical protein
VGKGDIFGKPQLIQNNIFDIDFLVLMLSSDFQLIQVPPRCDVFFIFVGGRVEREKSGGFNNQTFEGNKVNQKVKIGITKAR